MKVKLEMRKEELDLSYRDFYNKYFNGNEELTELFMRIDPDESSNIPEYIIFELNKYERDIVQKYPEFFI